MQHVTQVSLKDSTQPARIFLFLGLIVGVVLILSVPPMQVADEWPHFYRAYLLAQGRLMGEGLGGKVPEEIHRLMWETDGFMGIPTRGPKEWQEVLLFLKNISKLRIVEKNQVYVPFSTVLYAPVPYAGMSAAIAAAGIFTDSPLLLMYAGRLGGLLMALVMTYWAIRITPFGKWAFFLIAMTPITIFQRAGISADSFINALAMLYVAYVLKMALGPVKRIHNRNIILLALLAIAMCLCKQAYLVLPIFMWAIPADRYATPGGRCAARFGLPLLGWSIAILWAVAVMRINYAPVIKGTDALGQLTFILTHPIHYGAIMISDFAANTHKYIHELIGTLGWLDIPAFSLLVYAHAAVLLAISFVDHSDGACAGRSARILAAVTVFLSLGLIFTLMYLWWAPVGSSSLPGMQGRYFTPLLALLPAIFCCPVKKGFLSGWQTSSWLKAAMFTWTILLVGDTLYRTIVHYYR